MKTTAPTTFSICQKELLTALKNVSKTPLPPGFCEKNGIPLIYSCVLFTIGEGSVYVQGADKKSAIRSTVCISNQTETGDGLTFAVYLYDILPLVRLLDKQELTIEVNGEHMKFIHSSGSFSLPLMTNGIEIFKEYFNGLESSTYTYNICFDTPFLRSAFNRLSYAVAKDELRPVLNGVCVGTDGNAAYFVASDGHVLVRIQKQIEETFLSRFIVPSRSLNVLRHILTGTNTVSMAYTMAPEDTDQENKAVVYARTDTGTEYWFTPVEGRYPDFNKVIPTVFSSTLQINRNALVCSLKRLSLFTGVSGAARFQMDPEALHIKTSDKDFNIEAEEVIPATRQGCELTFGMKIKLLLNTLRNIHTENVTIQGQGIERAYIISPDPQPDGETVTMLVMPMALAD